MSTNYGDQFSPAAFIEREFGGLSKDELQQKIKELQGIRNSIQSKKMCDEILSNEELATLSRLEDQLPGIRRLYMEKFGSLED